MLCPNDSLPRITGDNMVNSEYVKDISKGISKTPLKQILEPGTTPRRYEPEGGVSRLNAKIHKESKHMDTYGNLPFSFRKPLKPKGRNAYVMCDKCGHVIFASSITVGMICRSCGEYSSVTEVEPDEC